MSVTLKNGTTGFTFWSKHSLGAHQQISSRRKGHGPRPTRSVNDDMGIDEGSAESESPCYGAAMSC
jgi:hypothetical protein